MKITQELLRTWDACDDGFQHFMDHWPEGAEYEVIQESLRKDGKYNWYQWLTNKVWLEIVADSSNIGALVTGEVTLALSATKGSPNIASGDYSNAASSGEYSTAASSGNFSTAVSSGKCSTAASSGKYSTAASSGEYSMAASSGEYSKVASSGCASTAASLGKYSKVASSGCASTAASSGEYSMAASSGEYSTAAASGKNTIAMVAGLHGQAKAGENGCIALCWHDGTRNRIVTGYVGEDIKADTLYHVRDGKLVEVST